MGQKAMQWDSNLLKSLMHQCQITIKDVAKATGYSDHLVHAWIGGNSVPTARAFVDMADLFGVSLDYLMGRCTEEEAAAIQKDYKGYFIKRIDAVWEEYLKTPRKVNKPAEDCQVELPWPYNLIRLIFCEEWESVNPFQEDGFNRALAMLGEREQDILVQRFREGKTLEEVSRIYGINRERTRQIENKAIRKLRYPKCAKLIREGYDPNGKLEFLKNEYERIDAEILALNSKDEENKRRETVLNQISAALDEKERSLFRQAEKLGLNVAPQETKVAWSSVDVPVENLDLSVRAYNILLYGKMATVADVLARGRENLLKLRGCGIGCYENIRQAVLALTGIDMESDYARMIAATGEKHEE